VFVFINVRASEGCEFRDVVSYHFLTILFYLRSPDSYVCFDIPKSLFQNIAPSYFSVRLHPSSSPYMG
jgi:hypothetical protein